MSEEERNLENVKAYKAHVNEVKFFTNTIQKFQEIETQIKKQIINPPNNSTQ
jgi:hypothetical protein